jgi:hypothetical protein
MEGIAGVLSHMAWTKVCILRTKVEKTLNISTATLIFFSNVKAIECITRKRRVGSGAPNGSRRSTRSCFGRFKWETLLLEVLRKMLEPFVEWSATITRIQNVSSYLAILFSESTLLFSLHSAFRIEQSEAQWPKRYLYYVRQSKC